MGQRAVHGKVQQQIRSALRPRQGTRPLTPNAAAVPTDETELFKVKNFLNSKYVDKSWFSASAAAAPSSAAAPSASTSAAPAVRRLRRVGRVVA